MVGLVTSEEEEDRILSLSLPPSPVSKDTSRRLASYRPGSDLHHDLICQHLDLELLDFRTVRNMFLLFKPHSLWHFAVVS